MRIRKLSTAIACVALATWACGGDEKDEKEGARCPADCTSELRLVFEHPLADTSGARNGEITWGNRKFAFFCDETGAGESDEFRCEGEVVRLFGLRGAGGTFYPSIYLQVDYPDDRLGLERTIAVEWSDTCGDACGLGEAAVQVELQGPRQAVCGPSDDDSGCSEALCRSAYESCGFSVGWDPNYRHCEEATGEKVDDFSHCAANCSDRGVGPMFACFGEWADLCGGGPGFDHVWEAREDCTCEERPPEEEAACRSHCVDVRLACDEGCPADSMAGCLDCSAACADAMVACFDACAGDLT